MQGSRLLAVVLVVAGAGCSPPQAVEAPPPAGFGDDRSVIQIVSTNVQGKNVYIPGTIVVTAGQTQTLRIFNTTDTPHGFSIAGLGIQEILPAESEHDVMLSDLEGGHVHQIHCQLHPPHRTATLVVLPGR